MCTAVFWCGRLHRALVSCTQQFGSASLLLRGPKIGPIELSDLLITITPQRDVLRQKTTDEEETATTAEPGWFCVIYMYEYKYKFKSHATWLKM